MTGPLGKGLLLEKEGVHIAFAAGTGVLSFIDLVAFVSKLCLEKIEKPKNRDSLSVNKSNTLNSFKEPEFANF